MLEASHTLATKRARTRERILDEALALFQHQGFDGTTMRQIAVACDLSLGAAYYHFESKEALVLAFYQRGAEEAHRAGTSALATTKSFKTRVRAILLQRLKQIAPYRQLVSVLSREATNLAGPLSPFSPHTQSIREQEIALFSAALAGSDLRVSKTLRPHVASLLWLMQLGIVLFWSNDTSGKCERTMKLVDLSLELLVPLLRATTLPFMGPMVQSAVRLIEVVEKSAPINSIES